MTKNDIELIKVICERISKYPDNIDIGDVEFLLYNSLEWVTDKKDLTDTDRLYIKNIRHDIKGL